MITKEYYQLEDLKYRFDLTDSDIRYFIEEQKIPLVFKVKPQDFIVGRYRKRDFIGHCIVRYGGLVEIEKLYKQKILAGKEVWPERFLLLQKGKLHFKTVEYCIEQKCPNDYIQAWQAKYPHEVAGDIFEAKLFPQLKTNPKWQMQLGFKSLISWLDKADPEETSKLVNDKMGEFPEEILMPNYVLLKFDDLCVQHETLIQLGLISSNPLPSAKIEYQIEPKSTPQLISPALKYKHQFEELLARIMTAHPELSAKKICRILGYESQQEEDSREFDKENILLDEVGNIICWRDKYRNNAERTYTHDTIGNMISILRKKIHQQSA